MMNLLKLVYPLIVIIFMTIPSSSSLSSSVAATASTYFNVIRFGATPNCTTNSTNAFLDAWEAACATNGSTTIIVPKGRYLLYPVIFEGGSCNTSNMNIQIYGTIIAPEDYNILGQVATWLSFHRVTNLSITGGALDARGSYLWASKAAGIDCPEGATTLRFTSSKNVVIKGLLSLNSQLYHIAINNCENVRVEAVRILALEDSPNTDGIHVQSSNNVVIYNTNIKTGDDCISIGPGTNNLWIERVACGPGHGISIGSLAKEMEEEGVQNVTVKSSVFTGSTNGLRIKSWARPSNGFVKGVQFISIVMRNVQNPIIIDQNYCPHGVNCPGQVSGVQISDVIYRNIQGTSATEVGVRFECSAKFPCTGIRLQNVNLTYQNEVAQSVCSNAIGKVLDSSILPSTCLYS